MARSGCFGLMYQTLQLWKTIKSNCLWKVVFEMKRIELVRVALKKTNLYYIITSIIHHEEAFYNLKCEYLCPKCELSKVWLA